MTDSIRSEINRVRLIKIAAIGYTMLLLLLLMMALARITGASFKNTQTAVLTYILVPATLGAVAYWLWYAREKALPALDPAKHPRVFAYLQELCKARGWKQIPRLHLRTETNLSAAAAGGFAGIASVIVSQGLCDDLEHEQLKAVIGHELGHIRYKDGLLRTLIRFWMKCLSSFLMAAMIFNLLFHAPMRWTITSIVLWLISLAQAELLDKAISRQQEYRADAYSALCMGSSKPMIDFLSRFNTAPHKNIFERLLSTHPQIPLRIAALERLESATETSSRPTI